LDFPIVNKYEINISDRGRSESLAFDIGNYIGEKSELIVHEINYTNKKFIPTPGTRRLHG
jgi:hypothetical protein